MAFSKGVSGILFLLLLTEISYGAAVQTAGGHATGKVTLDIDGVPYGVSFPNKYYRSVWRHESATFGVACDEPGDGSWHSCEKAPGPAMPAIDAVNSALNVAAVRAMQFDDGFIGNSHVVPWRIVSGEIRVGVPRKRPFAEFSRPIPIPAAVWLFISALMGLGWFRRN